MLKNAAVFLKYGGSSMSIYEGRIVPSFRLMLLVCMAGISGGSGCDRPHSRASRPTIQIVPVGADDRTSHTGEKYYLVDDRVGFKAVATDPEDGDLSVEILLRDEPYVPGTPITKEGAHAISATCMDSDGNVETDFRIINIYKHARAESYVSLAEIESYQTDSNEQMCRIVVFIDLPDLNAEDIDVSTIRVFGKTLDGLEFEKSVDGAWALDGRTPMPANADVDIQSGRIRCVFSEIPFSPDPTELQVHGIGSRADPSFLFWTDVDVPEDQGDS